MRKPTLRAGIAGARFAASFHFESAHRVHGTDPDLVGVFSRSSEGTRAFAEPRGLKTFTSLDALLDQIDVIHVCVPAYAHETVAIAALKRGVSPIVEKPFTGYFGDGDDSFDARAMSRETALNGALDSVKRMLDAEAASASRILYAENWVYVPAIQKEREIPAPTGVAVGRTLCYTVCMPRCIDGVFGTAPARAGLAAWLTVAAAACAPLEPAGSYHVGQILAVDPPAAVSRRAFSARLQSADVIYLGEAHDTPSHVAAAIQTLRAMLDGGRRPVLVMEMFGWDGQEGLDRYLDGTVTSTEDFLAESRWEENWGGDYAEYAPLVEFAKTHGLTLLGLNPPRSLVRTVARHGAAALADAPKPRRWTMPPFPPDDPEYRRVIYEQIEDCHEGLSQDVYQKIYEASVVRDEGMASVVTTVAGDEAREPGPVVSYTGAGHMQYGLPVPKRVQRQSGGSVRQVTVYLHALDPERPEDVERLLTERIADYVWLTAPRPQGRQPRCGE